MVFTYNYDSTYDGPPFPTVQVAIRNVGGSEAAVEERAYVDSGADGTMVSLALLQQIGARKVDEMNLRWGSGPSYQVDIYEILLQIGSYRAVKVYAAADRDEQPILLGRDVLNYFVITLNGLAEAVEVSQ